MRERAKHPLARVPLALQYFLWMALSIALLMVLMVMQNYRSTSRALENEYIRHATKIVEKNNSLIDAHYDAALSVLLQLGAQASEYLSLPEAERSRALRALERSNASLFTSAFVVLPDDTVVTAKQTLFRILGAVPLMRWVAEARSSAQGVFVSAPYFSLLSGETAAVLYPFRTRGLVAVAALELNLEGMRSLADPYVLGDSQSYLIMNRADEIVFFGQATGMLPTVPYTAFPEVEPAFVREVAQAEAPISTISHGGRRYLCIQSLHNRFGWRTVALVDEALFFQSRTEMLSAYLWLMALFLAVLLVNAWLLSRRFTAPVYDLVKQVNAITDIARSDVFVITRRQDAIGRLTESYNNLFIRIRQLIADIKESEKQKQRYAFQMLQHQISPHFLHNTLLCIGNMVKRGHTENVDKMIRALVSLLNYSMGAPDALVRLRDETDTVEKYLLIQNMRFGDVFRVEINISSEAAEKLVPKLILQPLVENAITHGLAPKRALYGQSPDDRLTITGALCCGRLHVTVSDNGIGMPEARLLALRQRILAPEPAAESEHIGLANVARRIGLYFGRDAEFMVESRENEGTVITITLPDGGA